MKNIKISTDFIKLGQFLKYAGIILNGSDAKAFLIENNIRVNNQREDRRGRKLIEKDIIEINEEKYIIVK